MKGLTAILKLKTIFEGYFLCCSFESLATHEIKRWSQIRRVNQQLFSSNVFSLHFTKTLFSNPIRVLRVDSDRILFRNCRCSWFFVFVNCGSVFDSIWGLHGVLITLLTSKVKRFAEIVLSILFEWVLNNHLNFVKWLVSANFRDFHNS